MKLSDMPNPDHLRRFWVLDEKHLALVAFVTEPDRPSGVGSPIVEAHHALSWLNPDEIRDLLRYIAALHNLNPAREALEEAAEAVRYEENTDAVMDALYAALDALDKAKEES